MSLFAGCGGSSLGYKAAGYGVRLAVDWDPKAAACYRANFPGTPFWEGDITSLSGGEALKLAGVGSGELDVLDGSPPCQGFSTAGRRRFADGRNDLFLEFAHLLGTFRPRAFVMENVSGLRKGKMKLKFAEITLALKGAGYRVSCRELNAWWYGVPQDRRRLFWVGVRGDLGVNPSHPLPIRGKPTSVMESLGLPGEIRVGIFGHKYVDTHLRASPSLRAAAPPLVRVKPYAERKLCQGMPSFTQIGAHRNWHPGEARPITLEEAKTLQGFPAWFQVSDYYLVGNSVPPPMAEAVGRHVALLLKGPAA